MKTMYSVTLNYEERYCSWYAVYDIGRGYVAGAKRRTEAEAQEDLDALPADLRKKYVYEIVRIN